MKEFAKIIENGPPLARVTKVEQNDMDVKEGEAKFVQYR